MKLRNCLVLCSSLMLICQLIISSESPAHHDNCAVVYTALTQNARQHGNRVDVQSESPQSHDGSPAILYGLPTGNAVQFRHMDASISFKKTTIPSPSPSSDNSDIWPSIYSTSPRSLNSTDSKLFQPSPASSFSQIASPVGRQSANASPTLPPLIMPKSSNNHSPVSSGVPTAPRGVGGVAHFNENHVEIGRFSPGAHDEQSDNAGVILQPLIRPLSPENFAAIGQQSNLSSRFAAISQTKTSLSPSSVVATPIIQPLPENFATKLFERKKEADKKFSVSCVALTLLASQSPKLIENILEKQNIEPTRFVGGMVIANYAASALPTIISGLGLIYATLKVHHYLYGDIFKDIAQIKRQHEGLQENYGQLNNVLLQTQQAIQQTHDQLGTMDQTVEQLAHTTRKLQDTLQKKITPQMELIGNQMRSTSLLRQISEINNAPVGKSLRSDLRKLSQIKIDSSEHESKSGDEGSLSSSSSLTGSEPTQAGKGILHAAGKRAGEFVNWFASKQN